MKPNSSKIYQIKVTLNHSKPPIWRRILVRSDTRLDQLHQILQIVMGWEDYHLHQFIINNDYYGMLFEDGFALVETKNEVKYKLNDFVHEEGFKMVYEYDFGDSWEHVLLVEKILSVEEEISYPICIKGKRSCPPEDVGGIWGYGFFLEAINDPDHEEHEDLMNWIGGEFDPEAFNLGEINIGLKRLSRQ